MGHVSCAGSAKLEVTFHVDQNGVLNVTACDLNSQRQEQWCVQKYVKSHSCWPDEMMQAGQAVCAKLCMQNLMLTDTCSYCPLQCRLREGHLVAHSNPNP